jgi:hypothetical protein
LKRLTGPISASNFAAAAGELEQRRRDGSRPAFEFLVELVDCPCQRPDAGDELACDPHLDFLLPPREPAADAVEVTRSVESAQGDDQGRVELVQVPAQPLLGSPPLVGEIVSMVDKQLDLAVHPLARLGPRQVWFS